MTSKALMVYVLLSMVCRVHAAEEWKTVDEGFLLTVPQNWQKKPVRCTDSHCGTYEAKTAELGFDEVCGLGYTPEKAAAAIDNFEKRESDPKLREPGEEIWRVDGRIAGFRSEKVDPAKYGRPGFDNRASLFVPIAGAPCYLSVSIFYKSRKDLPIARRVLQSVVWKAFDNRVQRDAPPSGEYSVPLTMRVIERGSSSRRAVFSGEFRGASLSLSVSERRGRVNSMEGTIADHRFVVDKEVFRTAAELRFDSFAVEAIDYGGVTSFHWTIPFGAFKECWINTSQGRESFDGHRYIRLSVMSDGELYESDAYDPASDCDN